MGINFFWMLVFATLLFCFPQWLVQFDININAAKSKALLNQTTNLFYVVSFLILFDNFRIIGFGALRGIKDANFPMLASFIAFWLVGLCAAYVFAFMLHWNGPGIWIGMTLGIACGAGIVLWRVLYKLKRLDLEKILAVR